MAACCRGKSTACAVTVWCSVVFSAATACTATVGSFSPGSFEHAADRHNAIASAPILGAKPTLSNGGGEEGKTNFGRCASVIGLEAPRDSLQRGDSGSVTRLAIGVSVARLRQSVLSVHDLKHGGFSRLVAHGGEAKAFAGELRRLPEGIELGAGGFSLIVEGA